MKIPFLYKYDPKVELIEEEDLKRNAINNKIEECNDSIKDPLAMCLIATIFGVLPFLLFLLVKYIDIGWHINQQYLEDTGTIFAMIALGAWWVFVAYNKSLIKRYKRLLKSLADNKTEEIKEKIDEDVFENSIKLSYKYLDQYYAQTREQARNGFYVTVFVAIFGAVLIASGIIIMYLGKTEPAYITCTSGVITEFIASVFFYLYNKTVTSMSKYHNKLVLSQNVSIALKVTESLPESDKAIIKKIVVEELLKNINSYLITSDPEENSK